MIAVHRASRHVYRYLIMVHAKPVTLGIAIREKTSLQKLVGRKAYSRYHMSRIECSLFYVGKIVLRVAVELKHTDFYKRKILMAPYFCYVERVLLVAGSLLFCHHLYVEFPGRIITFFYCIEQVASVALAVRGNNCCSLGIA